MWRPAECRARRLGAPQSPLIRPCGPPSPLGGEGLLGAFYRLPPLGGKLSSEARLMRGLTVEGRGIFRPRARYFPWMESTQRSSGRRPHKVRCAQDAQVWASLTALPCSSLPPLAFGHLPLTGGVGLSPQNPLRWAFVGARLVRSMHHVGPDASSGPKPPVRRARRPGAPRRRKFHIIHFRRDGENSFAPLLLLSPTKPSALPGAPPLSQGGLGAGGHMGPPLRRISFVVFVGADVLIGPPSRT